MKFTWEPKDIVSGRIVCKPKADDGTFKPDGWTAKWTYKIGWLAAGNPEKDYYARNERNILKLTVPITVAWL